MAVPYGKMIPCTIVVSPEKRGRVVIEAQGRQAERQLEKRGWTQQRSIWLAPIGWKYSATIIFPWPPVIGQMIFGYRFYDSETDKDVTIVTSGRTQADVKQAEKTIRAMGWRLFRGQWRAP